MSENFSVAGVLVGCLGSWFYYSSLFKNNLSNYIQESPLGIMAEILDCCLDVCNFKSDLRYYVHFQTNAFGKGLKV